MRKKVVLVVICILFAGIVFLIAGPLNFGIKKEIDIAAPIYNVAGEFTNLRNWRNWYPELKGLDSSAFVYSASTTGPNARLQTGDQTYSILEGNPAYLRTSAQIHGYREFESLYAFPDSLGITTRVIWIRALPVLSWLKEKLAPGREMETGLDNLKNFIEDPGQYYGFPIVLGQVEDTIVLTKTTRTLQSNRVKEIKNLFEEIRHYAQTNKIELDHPLMSSFIILGKDSVQVSAGISVTKSGPGENGFFYLRMPTAGKMLIGHYHGPYSGLNGLYRAMDKFVSDKRLQRIAIPYEKYESGSPFADSLHMTIKLYFPVI